MFSDADVIEYARERLIKKQGQTVPFDELLEDLGRWHLRSTGKTVDWSDLNVRNIFKSYFTSVGFSVYELTDEGGVHEVLYDAMLQD